MRVVLHIGELVLHGFPAGQRHAIAAALQGELQRMIVAEPLAGIGAAERLRAPAVWVTTSAPQTGRAVAASLHAALQGRGG